MRITTSMMFDSGTRNILDLQGSLYKLQDQLSTGRRILTPADDPVAAAQALVVSQRASVNTQFIDNQASASSQLSELEDRYSAMVDLLQSVKARVVDAGNAAYSDSNRRAISAEIRERYDELLGLANATDAQGQHVFSGFRGDTRPFSVSGSPGGRTISYAGDEGKRQMQVETDRVMDLSDSGADVFMRIPQGNGIFEFSPGAANTGTGTIGAYSMITGFNGSTYDISFTSSTSYSLVVTTNGVPAPATGPFAYVPGQDIVLGSGSQQFKVVIGGAPNAGDAFTAAPSTNKDVFSTLDQMISALESPVAVNDVTKAQFRNQMTEISNNLDQVMDRFLTRQTSIGARRIELEALSNVGADLNLQYQTDMSRLQDLDFTEAISSMANRKMVLEAAQLSFKQVSQMSLFNYL